MIDGLSDVVNSLAAANGVFIKFGFDVLKNICDFVDFDSCFFVADENTKRFLPKQAQSVLIMPDGLRPELCRAEQIMKSAKHKKVFVGFGGGTICDLCKYCSKIERKQCLIFVTCPSVNAFCSPTASLIINKKKSSILTGAPDFVFCDLSILTTCPIDLISSGFGDFISAEVADNDCLLSHLLLGSSYDSKISDQIEYYKNILCQNVDKLLSRDLLMVAMLMYLLLAQGFIMLKAQSSYPVSQGEHQIAHCLEEFLERKSMKNYLHGKLVAATSYTMSLIQQKLLELPSPKAFEKFNIDNKYINKRNLNKQVINEKMDFKKKLNYHNWDLVKERIIKKSMSHSQFRNLIHMANLPCDPETFSLSNSEYRDLCQQASISRNRFGFLDLYFECNYSAN